MGGDPCPGQPQGIFLCGLMTLPHPWEPGGQAPFTLGTSVASFPPLRFRNPVALSTGDLKPKCVPVTSQKALRQNVHQGDENGCGHGSWKSGAGVTLLGSHLGGKRELGFRMETSLGEFPCPDIPTPATLEEAAQRELQIRPRSGSYSSASGCHLPGYRGLALGHESQAQRPGPH